MLRSKLAQAFQDRIAVRHRVLDAVEEALSSSRSSMATIFSGYGKRRGSSSVVAVSRANRSFVIFSNGFSQVAGLTRWQITAANWWDRQGASHRISIGRLSVPHLRDLRRGYV